jgi:hypothetical protein
MMIKRLIATLWVMFLVAVGCGKNGNGDGPCGPKENIYVNIDGSVKMWDDGSPEGLFIGPVSPYEALANPDVVPFEDTLTAAGGTFSFECLDVTDVSRGLVLLVDDANFDKGSGRYFPTATGIVPWRIDSQKKDISDAMANAIPNTLVDQIDLLITDHDIRQTGFMMGMVWDSVDERPIPGATVTNSQGLTVKYPSADWSELTDDGTSTTGIFLLMEESRLNMFEGHADGYTFTDHEGGTQLGFCYFMVIDSI